MGSRCNPEMIDEIHRETIDSDEDYNVEVKDEIEYETKDPVKKYQFEYNKSFCMSHKYPEIAINKNDTVCVAPGEGKIPKDIMSEGDWDIKAFPHINNPNGSNGKSQERTSRLSDQKYFIHRVCNKAKRFARSHAYMYVAIGYIEKKQLQRNINLANTRGKELIGEKGQKAYVLEDGYRVLDNIKTHHHIGDKQNMK